MNTIEEMAEEYAGISEDKGANQSYNYTAYDIAQAFQDGAEFAQKWIPIDDAAKIRSDW